MDFARDALPFGNPADAGDARWGTGRRVASAAALLYLLYGALAVVLLARAMPPFQNADELSHFLRADQVSRGGLIAVMADDGAGGGRVEPNIVRAGDALTTLKFHPERRVDASVLQQVAALHWSTPQLLSFANTAMYPPVFYLPAALATAVGRGVDLSVVYTLKLARLASGLTSVALGATAMLGPRRPGFSWCSACR